jgi:energy-coupling factor transporter ATP-binding protein EcfA2
VTAVLITGNPGSGKSSLASELARRGCAVIDGDVAVNQRDMLDLFDRVFLLTLDQQTQVDRLNEPSNAHRNAAARAQILDGRPVFEAQMRAAGAIPLDGRQPIPVLATEILRDVASR